VDGYLPVEPGGVFARQRIRQRVVLPQGRQHVTGLHEAAVHGPVLAIRDLVARVPARGLGTRADLAVAVGDPAGRLIRHIAGGRAGDAVAAVIAIGGGRAGARVTEDAPFLAARP